MMPIKGCRSFILCIDHQGMGGNLGAGGTVECIGQDVMAKAARKRDVSENG